MSDLFLRACRGEAVERRPVWMMRQAGRYLPEYRRVRERADFLTMCKTPELAAAVTVQPVDLVGVDAAILFADILLPLEAMGAELAFVEGEGPVFARPVRGAADVGALVRPDVDKTLGYVYAAIALLRRELAGRVPLIGFGGTPWTLAAYLIEGGTSKSHAHLLSWSWRDPDGLARLLDLLADVSLDYLRGQVEAGVQAIQLFDTWGGLLDRRRFRELAVPPVLKIVEGLGRQVPLIYYVRGGSHLLPDLAELPVDVLSVDWRLPLDEVRRVVGPRLVLQGNLDPTALLGEEASIVAATREVLDAGRGGGHVVNLGHGILPSTPPGSARLFVETVKSHG
ncbi:MAG TPA: uroporphyrinogen decarboxylase [Thermoanaerobaculia bacterium]|jgi:uroporphyrinogen decarboxylase